MKSHFIKKIVSLVLCFVLVVCALTINVSAANKILSYWEANDNGGSSKAYVWNRIPSTVYVYDFYSEMPSSFDSGIENAINQWNSVLGSSMEKYDTNYVDETYNNTIKIYGGAGNYLNQSGRFEADMTSYDIAGYTEFDGNRITTDTYIYNGLVIPFYLLSKAHIAIVDLSTNPYLSTNYNFLCTHEMGHAMGWYGHSIYSGDVMQRGCRYEYTLTSRDKRHVTQFYNYGGTLK